jgi:hypothetical protein
VLEKAKEVWEARKKLRKHALDKQQSENAASHPPVEDDSLLLGMRNYAGTSVTAQYAEANSPQLTVPSIDAYTGSISNEDAVCAGRLQLTMTDGFKLTLSDR